MREKMKRCVVLSWGYIGSDLYNVLLDICNRQNLWIFVLEYILASGAFSYGLISDFVDVYLLT